MATIEPTKFESTDPGIYSAVISEIEESTHPEFGRQLKFVFTLLDDDNKPTDETIWAWCGAKWNPKAKLFTWAQAILRKKCPSADEPFDYDDLLQKRCDLKVELVKSKTTGQERSAVTAVYPFGSMTTDDAADAA